MSVRAVARSGLGVALILLLARAPQARDEQLPGWFDLEVPGGEATLAELGLFLEDRAVALPVLARSLHDRDQRGSVVDSRLPKTVARISALARSGSDVITVPAPLDADVWRDVLPPVRPPASNNLFVRILNDRHALLMAAGLSATTDSARAFLARDRELLRFIYLHAPAFAVMARRLTIEDRRILVPGGEGAAAIWEALVGVAPTRPAPFLQALLSKDEGRLAWYYDCIGGLDSEQLSAAWPASLPPAERAAALYPAFRGVDPQWRITDQPFRRGSIDAWIVVTQNTSARGVVTSPLPHATWDLLFGNSRAGAEQIKRTLLDPRAVPLPWLARETLTSNVRERRIRFEMFRLAQRVFRNAPTAALADVAVAVSGARDSRALVLTLERMQIHDAATWATAVGAARFVNEEADDRRPSLASFQASVALLERMRHVRTLDVPAAAALVRSLSTAVRADKRVAQSIGRWTVATLLPALPPLVSADAFTGTTAYESRLLQALAGPSDRQTPKITWEGLAYSVDPVAAEHERLLAVRALLPSPGLDAALVSERPRDVADALTTLVYATALGDPEGPASLSPDVVARHQFGLSATTIIREELPWAPPEERQGQGPWHVQGSLLGMDLALSRLFLRRVADQQMPPAPTLTLNDVGTLTRTGAGMVWSELVDEHRDEIAAAIARGRARVAGAATTAELIALARECGMSDSTRQLLTWMASRQREVTVQAFALRDLLWLGNPALSREILDRWGVAADGLDGRRVLLMPGPAPWEDYAGRSEIGQLTTQVPDVTLRIVEETARMKLPAQLVPALLGFALEDYWHDVRARFVDDWPRLTRTAANLTTTRINDYVAALAGGGPLRAQ